MNWELKTIKVKDLIEWSGNPRKISREDLDNLKQSFTEFGHARTLTVAPEGKKFVIIGGNQSLKALKELDFKEIQCSVADREMTEHEKQKLSVFLNHRAKGEGEWDYDILNTWDVDLADWGLDSENLETNTNIKKTIENKPYNKTHVLISFNPEKILELKPYLEKIIEIEDVEYEQSSN